MIVFLDTIVVIAVVVVVSIIIYKNKKNSKEIHKVPTNGSSADKKSQQDKSSSEFTTYEEIKEKTENCQLRQRKLPQTQVDSEKTISESEKVSVSERIQTSDHSNIQQLPRDFDGVSTVSSGYPESVCSLDTILTTQEDNNVYEIPTWNEISDHDKNLYICRACDNEPVKSIMKPCNHAYMCNKCAPILYDNYRRCPLCKKKGKYEYIE